MNYSLEINQQVEPPNKFRLKQKLLQKYKRDILPSTHTQHSKQANVQVITSRELDYILQASSKTPQTNYLLNNDRFEHLYQNLKDMRLQIQKSRTHNPRYELQQPDSRNISFVDIYRAQTDSVQQTNFQVMMQKRLHNRRLLLNKPSPSRGMSRAKQSISLPQQSQPPNRITRQQIKTRTTNRQKAHSSRRLSAETNHSEQRDRVQDISQSIYGREVLNNFFPGVVRTHRQ